MIDPLIDNDNDSLYKGLERRMDENINLTARVAQLETLVNHLIEEARVNNRIAIVAIAVMAAGKEILSVWHS